MRAPPLAINDLEPPDCFSYALNSVNLSVPASVHDMEKQLSEDLAAARENERRRYLAQPFFEGVDDEDALRTGMPRQGIEFVASGSSVGLQLVDIYLWIMRCARSGTAVSGELENLGRLVGKRKCVESISPEGIKARWNASGKNCRRMGIDRSTRDFVCGRASKPVGMKVRGERIWKAAVEMASNGCLVSR